MILTWIGEKVYKNKNLSDYIKAIIVLQFLTLLLTQLNPDKKLMTQFLQKQIFKYFNI
jgi:hypothetical protein